MSDRNCEKCASLITSECGEPDCEWGHAVAIVDGEPRIVEAVLYNNGQCEDRSEE